MAEILSRNIEIKKQESNPKLNPKYSILEGVIEKKIGKTDNLKIKLDSEQDLKSLKETQEKTKENLDNLKIITEIRTKISKDFSKVENFEGGMSFLLSQNRDVLVLIKDIFNGTLKNNIQNRILDFFNEESFFSDNNTLNKFIEKYKSYAVKDKKDEVEIKENKDELTSFDKNIKNLCKINPIFQKTLKDFGLEENKFAEGFQKLDKNKQKEFALNLLSQIQKEAKNEPNPEKKKELESMFTSISSDFVSAGLITHGEIALIRQNIDRELSFSDNKFKPEGYRSYDNGNTLIKNEKGINEIITFDSAGKPSEKIASSSTGYEVKLDSSISFLRDIAINESKINRVKVELNGLTNNYQDLLRNSGLLISLKPEYILSVLAKNPQDITSEKDREIYKELKKSENVIKEIHETIKILEARLKIFENRKTEYLKQKQANQDKFLGIEEKKVEARNKIEVLDSLGMTKLPQKYVDEILKQLENPELKIFDKGIDFNNPETKNKLKEIFAKLLGKNTDQIYEKNSLVLVYPYNEAKGLLDGLNNPPPGVYKDGVFNQQGFETRLKQTDNSEKQKPQQ